MDYDFKAPTNFIGDSQIEKRSETLSLILCEMAQIYLRATVILGLRNDSIADCLRADAIFVATLLR